MQIEPQQFWQALDAIPDLSAVPRTWRAWLGDHFEPFKSTFLESKPYTVEFYPCPVHCLCAHCVYPLPDGSFVAKCECEPPECPDIPLTHLEVVPLFFDLKHAARVISRIFDLKPSALDFDLDRTSQIGSWSADAVPVFFTVQFDRYAFQRVVAQLIGRLHQPLIILAPTAGHLDSVTQEIMSNFAAAFFSLESTTILDPDGTLRSRSIPGELFAQFNPQPTPSLDEHDARALIAIAAKLDTGPDPTRFTVFRLYYIERKTIAEIAAAFGVSLGTIHNRLKALTLATGLDAKALRAYYPYFAKIQDELSDSRAKHIRPE
jgi:Sigma-70, region 4